MSKRKSLFELLICQNNINLEIEYKTIKKLLDQPGNIDRCASISKAIDYYIVPEWKYSNRCVELDDLRKKIGITNYEIDIQDYPLEKCLLFFELIYNLVKLLIDRYKDPQDTRIRRVNEYDVYKIIENIEGLLEELNYKIEKIEDRYVIVEKDIVATAVAENNIDIAEDIIEYRRFNLKGEIETKKAIILKLADKIEPLRTKFKGTNFNTIMDDVQMFLNNLNLRHNNLEGKNKKEVVVNMSKEELERWYDKVFDMILSVLQINEYIKDSSNINNLKQNL